MTQSIELSDVLNNPERFGLPSFEDFARQPEHYRKKFKRESTVADMLGVISNNSKQLGPFIRKQWIEYNGIKIEKLEYAERMLTEEGFTLETQVLWKPEMRPCTDQPGKADIAWIIERKSGIVLL